MARDFISIEKKWQKKWEREKIFQSKEDKNGERQDAVRKKKKFYVLEMYPYPSASGLHMGHAFNYTIGDVLARFKRMQGFNVLHPMGYDSFGLPAENAAIKSKSHPKKFTENAIKNFVEQQHMLGLSYDWERKLMSHDENYYKWNQWIFSKMFEKGLAYRKKAPVNWCGKCDTVLANEQVHDGKCWRHTETDVEIKNLEQWFIKTTDYAEELYDKIDSLDWPERIKTMQKNWIAKSEGTEIDFEIALNEKTNFVILHGFTSNPKEDFHPWLKEEMEKREYKIQIPKLPNTNNPNITEQVDYVLKNCKFDENTILIGHSLGCAVALKVLEKLKKPVKKLVLAAGFSEPGFKDKKRPFEDKFNWKFDFKKIRENAGEIKILRAKNDSAVPPERASKLREEIGGEIIDFVANDDHICGKEEPEVLNACLKKFPIFTTRPDTLYGVTFMVISAQHSQLSSLISEKQKKEVEKFLKKIKSTKQEDLDKMGKEGVFTGSYAINPINNEKVPIYAGNFVFADYGSGMVMAVPAHDQRDFEFAKKYKLPIKQVVSGGNVKEKAFVSNGTLINSSDFNELDSAEAKEHITKALEFKKLGRKTTNYKLKDWLVSRQRYWGTPIPIVYCDPCGIQPVSWKDLPVLLPEKVEFGKGNPLETNKKFLETKCPKCGKKARRETDTMDTFFDSSWYYLRFCDNKNKKEIFSKEKIKYWMPVDFYTGGAEHACMHLIYARFFTKALRDLGLLNFDEPFKRLFNQGMVHGEDGFVMSKSRGNVIDPSEIVKKYGADTMRLFLMSVASPDKDTEWSVNGIDGSFRFVNKLKDYSSNFKAGKSDAKVQSKLNKTIKEFTSEIENLSYNIAIIKLRTFFEYLSDKEISKSDFESFLKMLSIFMPHFSEEMWESLGNKKSILLSDWPKFDEKKINDYFEKEEAAIEKIVSDIMNILKIVGKKENAYIYVIPKEKEIYLQNLEEISNRTKMKVKVFSVNEDSRYDPKGFSKKAKFGKPAIYIE